MDALDVVRLCVWRWYVFVPVVLLAAAAGFGLSTTVKPEYTAYASYALVFRSDEAVKSDAADPRTQNPLGVNGGTLLGEALKADLNTEQSQRTFGGSNRGWGPGETSNDKAFSVTLPQNTQSYIVQTWGSTPDAVRDTVDQVLSVIPGLAKSVQERAGAPEKSRYSTFVTVPTQVAELPPQSKMKVLLPVVGVGIAAGVALSLLVERLRTRRGAVPPTAARRRRPRRPTSDAIPAPRGDELAGRSGSALGRRRRIPLVKADAPTGPENVATVDAAVAVELTASDEHRLAARR